MKYLLKTFFSLLLLLVSLHVFALEESSISDTKDSSPMQATEANWVFSGMVRTELDEKYSYYFQIQRKQEQVKLLATLVDMQSHKALFYEELQTKLEQSDKNTWQLGKAFLRFNVITNSWAFGIKTADKKGFNFKVDMLQQLESAPLVHKLKEGVSFRVQETGHLNGHLFLGSEKNEQFVIAKKNWFMQLWLHKAQLAFVPLVKVLCQFADGNAFYAIHLESLDAFKGALAGWRDEEGHPLAMSQFVGIQAKEEDLWKISIHSPLVELILQNVLAGTGDPLGEGAQIVAGITAPKLGFCTITKESLG